MSLFSKRLVSIAASTLVLSLVSASANAELIDVLTNFRNPGATGNALNSTYKFTGSMILNSIGFYSNGASGAQISYSINGTTYLLGRDFTVDQLSSAENGFRYLTITPKSLVQNDILIVNTTGGGTGGQAACYEYDVTTG